MEPRGIVGYLSPWGLEPETFTDPLDKSLVGTLYEPQPED